MSSVSLTHPTNEAFADIKEEIQADYTKKKLGVFFWICAGWIVLVAMAATFASLLPLPNPTLGNYSSSNAGPGWVTSWAPTTSHASISPSGLRGVGLPGGRLRRRVDWAGGPRYPRHDLGLPERADRHGPQHRLLHRSGLPRHRGRHRAPPSGASRCSSTLVIGLFAAPLIFRVVRASTLSYA